MAAISLDLRTRILAAWHAGEDTRQEIADRFVVSLGMVKKLIAQDKELGHVRNLYDRVGRKHRLGDQDLARLCQILAEDPSLTLLELREKLGVPCSEATIHRAAVRLGHSFKKRAFEPANRTATTSEKDAPSGAKPPRRSTPDGSSSSTKPAPKQT